MVSVNIHPSITLVAIGATTVFFFLSLVVLCSRIVRNAWRRHSEATSRPDLDFIDRFIAGDAISTTDAVTRSKTLQNNIAKAANHITGEIRTHYMEAYTALGFTKRDFRRLQSWSRKTRALALARCRNLLVPIPNDGWAILLKDPDETIRWAALEYLINLKGLDALPWVRQYLSNAKNERRGQSLHLLSCLASKSPESIVHIITTSDNPLIIELCLRVLAIYPAPQTHTLITRYLSPGAEVETVVAAMKALGAFPNPDALQSYEKYVSHPHWVVRLEIARALSNFDELASVNLLETMTVDAIYHVRYQAIKTLLKLQPVSSMTLSQIAGDHEHPSFAILEGLEHEQQTAT